MTQIALRYGGLQARLQAIDSDGCNFLTLCSIAEQYNQYPVDLIRAVNLAYTQGLIKDEYTVQNDCILLSRLTNKKWTKKVVSPAQFTMKPGMYVIAVFYNPRTNYKHFRRPEFDVLEHSVTVAEGFVLEYRIYTVEE